MKRKILTNLLGLLLFNSITVLAQDPEPRTSEYPWFYWRGKEEDKAWWYADSDPKLIEELQEWRDMELIPKDVFLQTLKILKIPVDEVPTYRSFRSFIASQNLDTFKALIDLLPNDYTKSTTLDILLIFTILSDGIPVDRRCDMVDLLIRSGVSVNGYYYHDPDLVLPSEFSRRTPPPLKLAMRKERFAVAKLLIKSGAEVDRLFHDGQTLLVHAVRYRPYFVKMLIDAGANPNKPTKYYVPLLHYTAMNGDYLNTNLLLDSGANPTAVVNWSEYHRNHNAMHEAAVYGYKEIIDIYLERKIFDVDVLDGNGCSSLYIAVEKKHPDLIRYLLQKGANRNLKSHHGMSPFDLAMRFQHPEIIAAFNEF